MTFLMKQVYFDSAATTQMHSEVIKKMASVMNECYGNPSSTHSYGRQAKSAIESSRKKIAEILNVSASEIIFTSGGTEADNLILRSNVKDLGVKEIITSKIEHHAVLHTVEELQKEYGVKISYVNLTSDGSVDLVHLETLLSASNDLKLVSLMHVNNEIGNILDINKVCSLCQSHNALFHSDTVQCVGHFKMDLKETPIDFIAVSAHKFHGPKGVGFAYIKKKTGLKASIFGGQQERGLRAGTESVHNIVGLQLALELAYEHLEEEKKYIENLKSYFRRQLIEFIPGVSFNGACADFSKSTYTLLNVRLPISQDKAPLLQFQLDLKGIACSKGSACQSGSVGGSHVLKEILSPDELTSPSLRFSFSKYNTESDIDYVLEVLTEFVNENVLVG